MGRQYAEVVLGNQTTKILKGIGHEGHPLPWVELALFSVFPLVFLCVDHLDARRTLMPSFSISEIGSKLAQAGRLKTKPLCVYGSEKIPKGVVASASVSSCVARAIFTLAFREKTPPIYVSAEMRETCCAGGLAQFGFTELNPGIKYFVSTGWKGFRNGAAEFLTASPDLFEENRKLMGKITPPGKYLVIRPCADLVSEDPGVRSVLCFGIAEQIRNLCSLVQFRSRDPFREIIVPQGASCASFVSYAAGMVENAPANAVYVGPCDPTGNVWFPSDHLSLAIPVRMARRMSEDLESSFIIKRPTVAYPERRTPV